jgi:hypothetical protein
MDVVSNLDEAVQNSVVLLRTKTLRCRVRDIDVRQGEYTVSQRLHNYVNVVGLRHVGMNYYKEGTVELVDVILL